MGKTSVPEELLGKLEPHFRDEVHDLKEASEPLSVRRAEVALSTRYLLSLGIGRKAGLSREEDRGLSTLATGQGYPEKVETKAG